MKFCHDQHGPLNNGFQTDVAYIEFANASDSIPHPKLLLKLKDCGVGDAVLASLNNFFVQCVTVALSSTKWGAAGRYYGTSSTSPLYKWPSKGFANLSRSIVEL